MARSMSSHLLQVHAQGRVASQDVDYARTKIEAALSHVRDPVLSVRARLTLVPDPAVPRPALVQVNVDLNGSLVRVQDARPTMREAVDHAHDQLRERLERASGDWEAIRGERDTGAAREWRHGDAPTDRPPWYPRPVEERRIVRHKTVTLGRATVDEVVSDLEMLGYAFHLFTEDGSGVDSVVYRASDGSGLRLSQLEPHPEEVTRGATPFRVSRDGAPTLTVEQAVDRLNVTGWPFVFFGDQVTGRGRVLYHRYDGHYGLITTGG